MRTPYEHQRWKDLGYPVLLASCEMLLKDSCLIVRLYFQALAMTNFCH